MLQTLLVLCLRWGCSALLALSTPVLPWPLGQRLCVPSPKIINTNVGALEKHEGAEGAIEIWEIRLDLRLIKAAHSLPAVFVGSHLQNIAFYISPYSNLSLDSQKDFSRGADIPVGLGPAEN